MFLSVEVNVPSATSIGSAIETTIKLCKGTLTRVVFRPAPGPNWEVFGKLLHREFSLFPREQGQWLALERYPVEITPNWTGWESYYKLALLFCSPQARFDHKVQVEFEVDEKPGIVQVLMDFISKGF